MANIKGASGTQKVKLTTEQYEEEITKLNEEIQVNIHELNDTLALNTDFANKIEKKDKDLIVKDARLKLAREKNAAELEQLQVEVASMRESTTHEINFHTSEVHNLRMSKQRYLELIQENERLKKSINILEEMTRQDRENHAIQMHEMNKGRRDLRLAMEAKLRKELAGIEISFQKEAFQALHERQKLAMFENAKLKDEVAIQGVGITNLTARLLRQQKFCEKCEKQIQVLRTKAKKLRDQLAAATQHRNDIQRQRESLTVSYDDNRAQFTKLTQQYHNNNNNDENNTSSTSQQLLDKYTLALRKLREEQTNLLIWTERHKQLNATFLELRATNEAEQFGQYLPSLFPIFTMFEELKSVVKEAASSSLNTALNKANCNTLQLILQSLDDNQKSLQQALHPALTRDPTLLSIIELLAEKETKLQTLKTQLQSEQQQLDEEEQRLFTAAANGGTLEDEEDLSIDNYKQKSIVKEIEEAEINGQDMISWATLKIFTLWHKTSTVSFNQQEYEREVQQALSQQQLLLSSPQNMSLRSAAPPSEGSSIASAYFSPLSKDIRLKQDEDGNEDNNDLRSIASEHILDNINEEDDEDDKNYDNNEKQDEVFDTFNPDPKSVQPVTSSDMYDDSLNNRDGLNDLPLEMSVSQRQTMIGLSSFTHANESDKMKIGNGDNQYDEEEAAAWSAMTMNNNNLQLQIDDPNLMNEQENASLLREQEYDDLMLYSSPQFMDDNSNSLSSSWLKPLPKYSTNIFVQEMQSTLQPKNPLVVNPNDEIMRYGKDAFDIGPPLLIKHSSMKVSSSTPTLTLLSPLEQQQLKRPLSSSSMKRALSSSHYHAKNVEAFDISISHTLPSFAKKSSDPLLQKLSVNKLASTVQVSSKVLRKLPKSLSTSLLVLQQQRDRKVGSRNSRGSSKNL